MADISNVVVAGKSGAGKQPRIDVLVEEYGLTQLSTGNIFRAYLGAWGKVRDGVDTDGLFDDGRFADEQAIRARVAPAAQAADVEVDAAVLGFKAAMFVDRGLFVPDDITNALLASALRAAGGAGLVLDGYPRTPAQSDFLIALVREEGSRIDLVLVVDNEDEAIVARTAGRRICPEKTCGRVYHLEHKPPRDGKYCTACGAEVIQRSDDTEEKIRTRLAEFQSKARPAIDRLVEAGVPVAHVPGNLPVFTEERVRASVLEAIGPVVG